MFSNEGHESYYCSEEGQIRSIIEENGQKFVSIKKNNKTSIENVVKDIDPDVVHAHDRSASILAAKHLKKPIFVHMHVNSSKGFKEFLKNVFWLLHSRKFKHIFWVSKSAFDSFPFHGLLKGKSSILYNVLDKNDVIRKSMQATNQSKFDLIYVGRLSYQKNPMFLMEVIKRLELSANIYRVAIVGDGDYLEEMKTFAKINKLSNVEFLGFTYYTKRGLIVEPSFW